MFENPFQKSVQFTILREGDVINQALHPEEEELLSPEATEERRLEFRLGRIAAQRALNAIGINSPVLRHADRSPIWPDGVVGSIAHTANVGVAAVAMCEDIAGLGLDIEDLTRQIDPAVASLIANPAEQCWISGSSDRLIMLFSAKEAVFKALSPKCADRLSITDIYLIPTHEGFIVQLDQEIKCRLPISTRLIVRCNMCFPLVMTSVTLNKEIQ